MWPDVRGGSLAPFVVLLTIVGLIAEHPSSWSNDGSHTWRWASPLQGAHAWWCKGHMLVAEIAAQTVQPSTASCVNNLVAALSQAGPFPRVTDMVESACWADDLKGDGLYVMGNWHFVDLVFNPTNYSPIVNPNYQDNVISVLHSLQSSILSASSAGENVNATLGNVKRNDRHRRRGRRYGLSADAHSQNPWELAFEVANVIHFFGDIHQPLHTTALFSAAFPAGDEGGNLFKVTVPAVPGLTELHEVWDSMCGTMTMDPVRPLNVSARLALNNESAFLLAKYGSSVTPSALGLNSTAMAAESHALAVSVTYLNGTLQPHATLTPSYLQSCLRTSERQIVVAGLRLAHFLDSAFAITPPAACQSP